MKPGERKTVQARILEYAEAIGWTFVPREEAEQRREFDSDVPPADRAKNRSLFFNPVKHGQAKSVVAWPYSSFHRFVELGSYAADWGGDMENSMRFGER